MLKTIKLTTAQAIIKFLDNVYIKDGKTETKFVYGFATIFGHGNVLGLGEALATTKHDFKMYQGKNEQGMAHIAIGYAKQKNRQSIIACTSSIGPGAANFVTAAGTATVNSIPLLLFPGDTFASRRPDPVLQQIEQFNDPNTTTNDAHKAVSKYWDRISRPEQIITSLPWAINVLVNPETTGAVTIALPQDVQAEVYDYPENFLKKRVYHLPRIDPSNAHLKIAAQKLAVAKKPIAIIGGGVRYSLARKEVLSFLEKYNIPFVSTQAGKSALPSSSKLNLGGVGVTGNLSANLYAKTADLVLGLGTKYSDFTTGSKSQFDQDAKFINFNVKDFDGIKMNGFFIKGDIKKSVSTFSKIFSKFKIDFISQDNEIKKVKELWINEFKRLTEISTKDSIMKPEVQDINNKSGLFFEKIIKNHYKEKVTVFSQTRVLGIIREHLKDDSPIVGAAGSLPGDLQRMWETDTFGSYNLEYGYSCMGHEIQAAIGSSIAINYKPAFAFVGDGSFLMLHSEMHTAVQENIPVVIFLFDNSGFGCINNLQVGNNLNSFETEFYNRKNKGKNDYNSFMVTKFAEIAKAYGFDAKLVKNENELIEVVKKANFATSPTFIEIKVLPKSMTHGYESEWQVGLAQVSEDKNISDKAKKIKKFFKDHNSF